MLRDKKIRNVINEIKYILKKRHFADAKVGADALRKTDSDGCRCL